MGFQLGQYDPDYPIVIDPELVAAFDFGGSGIDVGRGIGVDPEGNLIITGNTFSNDFPTMNPIDSTFWWGVLLRGCFCHQDQP